jgi:hypothetical protein
VGPQNRSGRYEEEKNLALRGIEPRPSSLLPVAIPALFSSGCLLVGNIMDAACHASLVLITVNNGMIEMCALVEAGGCGGAVLSS